MKISFRVRSRTRQSRARLDPGQTGASIAIGHHVGTVCPLCNGQPHHRRCHLPKFNPPLSSPAKIAGEFNERSCSSAAPARSRCPAWSSRWPRPQGAVCSTAASATRPCPRASLDRRRHEGPGEPTPSSASRTWDVVGAVHGVHARADGSRTSRPSPARPASTSSSPRPRSTRSTPSPLHHHREDARR